MRAAYVTKEIRTEPVYPGAPPEQITEDIEVKIDVYYWFLYRCGRCGAEGYLPTRNQDKPWPDELVACSRCDLKSHVAGLRVATGYEVW